MTTEQLPKAGKAFSKAFYEALDAILTSRRSIRGAELRAAVEATIGRHIECSDAHWSGISPKFVNRFLHSGTTMPIRMAKEQSKKTPTTPAELDNQQVIFDLAVTKLMDISTSHTCTKKQELEHNRIEPEECRMYTTLAQYYVYCASRNKWDAEQLSLSKLEVDLRDQVAVAERHIVELLPAMYIWFKSGKYALACQRIHGTLDSTELLIEDWSDNLPVLEDR